MAGTHSYSTTGIVARGRIYVATDNKVYAFKLPGGTPTPTPTPTATPYGNTDCRPQLDATATDTHTNGRQQQQRQQQRLPLLQQQRLLRVQHLGMPAIGK